MLTQSFNVIARTVSDWGDGLQIEGQPSRVVVLEYSFVDALAAVELSPVGVADDNKPQRIIPAIRQKLASYTSVGLRGQPNLETIASLKPDLIIADYRRHQAIYDDLKLIAPTLLLPSFGEDYQTVLSTMSIIGKALGREQAMQQRLQVHEQRMDQYQQQLATDQRYLFAVISSRGFTMHSPKAFASGVLQRLGITHALPEVDNYAYLKAGFEQLVQANPDWLLLAIYGESELLERWRQSPLWRYLSAVKKQQVIEVSPGVWSLGRGMVTAEQIAVEVLELSQR